jgi:hypothetical protein
MMELMFCPDRVNIDWNYPELGEIGNDATV